MLKNTFSRPIRQVRRAIFASSVLAEGRALWYGREKRKGRRDRMERQAEKAACRALALSRRRALAPEERRARSLQICRALEGLEELRGSRTVLGYVPSGSECDLRPFYETLRKRGVSVAFPVTLSDGEMEAYVPVGPLLPGRCGIPEPDAAVSRRIPAGTQQPPRWPSTRTSHRRPSRRSCAGPRRKCWTVTLTRIRATRWRRARMRWRRSS